MGVVKLMGAQEPKRCPLDTFGSPSLMYHDPPCCQLHLVEFESIDCTLLRTYRISRMSCVPGKDTDNLEVHQFSKKPNIPTSIIQKLWEHHIPFSLGFQGVVRTTWTATATRWNVSGYYQTNNENRCSPVLIYRFRERYGDGTTQIKYPSSSSIHPAIHVVSS